MDRVVFLFLGSIYPTNCKQKNHSFCLCCWSTFYSIELVIIRLMWIIQIILLVGTKLQMIITDMALKIQDRGEVVKGEPVVQPGDELFWFNNPRLVLFLIHLVLFLVNLMICFLWLNQLSKMKYSYSWVLKIVVLGSVLQNAFQLAFFTWSTVSISSWSTFLKFLLHWIMLLSYTTLKKVAELRRPCFLVESVPLKNLLTINRMKMYQY